jgi:NAD-dependent SIR2 family protein deacetylase
VDQTQAEVSLTYEPRRDVVFVLGAGASAPDGVPLQRDLLPFIAASDDPDLSRSWMGSGLRGFLDTWFGAELSSGCFPSLEEVFGFLDYHISTGEALGEDWPVEALGEIRRALVVCIHHAIHVASNGHASTYRSFWERVGAMNRNIGVVTLNYDALLETAFDPLYPDKGLIDYCFPLMNYENPKGIPGFWWWIDPTRPVRIWEGKIPAPIRILKVHGSLNWKYCPTCRGLLLTPWDTSIDLDDGGFRWVEGPSCHEPETVRELRCPNDGTPFETLIVPPSHLKRADHPVLSSIVSAAMRELRAARHVVFIGYSFPEADVYLRSVFARSIDVPVVTVVDPGLSTSSRARYQSVCREVRFVESGFAEFVSGGALDNILNSSLPD